MAINSIGIAAHAADKPLTALVFDRRAPRADDVVIKIDYCGICHSDLHIAKNDWGFTNYPVVLGHEIIGRVVDVGADVSGFSIGDLVGVGCLVDSCQHCKPCEADLEQYCENGYVGTAGGRYPDGEISQGGFSDKIVVKQDFVLQIPDNLSPAAAAPLLCAGITSYSPLRHWAAGPGKKVGIVGLGGLGHIAVKMAKAMGAAVSVFTTSNSKTNQAIELGADEVIVTGNPDFSFASHRNSFDLILNTVSAPMDLNPYISMLALNGTMVMLGAPAGTHTPPQVYLLESMRRSLAGSAMGGIRETQEMLDFCGRENITCDIELIQPEYVNQAMERLEKGDVKFRFVLDLRTLKPIDKSA